MNMAFDMNNFKKWSTWFFCIMLQFPLFLSAQDNQRPNIILIVSDDHGTDALGSYGNSVIKTPALDNLAKDGVQFNNAFCTSSSCSPSRSVILTGMYNHANGMYGLEHSYHHFSSLKEVESLPVKLSKEGYKTVRIGKYHLAPESVYAFDESLSEGKANNNDALGRSPVEMADICKSIFSSDDKKPFFLYFCTDDPHRGLPFDSWPGPNPFGNRTKGYPGVKEVTYKPEEVLVPDFLPDNEFTRKELAQYYQSVSRMDQGVGRLVENLKKEGLYDNTVIVYISDNGIAFPGAKTTLYDPGMKLPCIVKLPNQKNKSSVTEAMVSWVDITPTLLDFAGVTSKKLHGKSFKDVLYSPSLYDGRDTIFASHSLHEITMYYPMRVIRTKKYKFIWNIAYGLKYPFAWDLIESTTWKGAMLQDSVKYADRKVNDFLHRPEFELYDLENDPGEHINIADNEEYSALVNELKLKTKTFQKNTNDPWFHKWKYE